MSSSGTAAKPRSLKPTSRGYEWDGPAEIKNPPWMAQLLVEMGYRNAAPSPAGGQAESSSSGATGACVNGADSSDRPAWLQQLGSASSVGAVSQFVDEDAIEDQPGVASSPGSVAAAIAAINASNAASPFEASVCTHINAHLHPSSSMSSAAAKAAAAAAASVAESRNLGLKAGAGELAQHAPCVAGVSPSAMPADGHVGTVEVDDAHLYDSDGMPIGWWVWPGEGTGVPRPQSDISSWTDDESPRGTPRPPGPRR